MVILGDFWELEVTFPISNSDWIELTPNAPTAVASLTSLTAPLTSTVATGIYFALGEYLPPYKANASTGQPGTNINYCCVVNSDTVTFPEVPFTQMTMVTYDTPSGNLRVVADYSAYSVNQVSNSLRGFGYTSEDAQNRIVSFTELALTPSALSPPSTPALYPSPSLYPNTTLYPSSGNGAA